MNWRLSDRFDPEAVALTDRHYSRQKPGTPQFVPPGRCLVLTADSAVWVTSWPYEAFTHHAWAGAWICSIFRNEGVVLSSALINEAVAATRWRWPDTPALGMVTFVKASAVRPKRDPGRCFRKAGFRPVGHTGSGLLALQLLPADMPEAAMPNGAQLAMEMAL